MTVGDAADEHDAVSGEGRVTITSTAGPEHVDIELWYETFGDAGDPTLLLVCGLGAQALNFDSDLCEAFADRRLHVVRYDNRDAGLSTHLHEGPSYDLSDMARDAVGLLDHLGVDRAHLWGSSMGGMIAQMIAIESPDRVATLTSVQSTTGEPDVGHASPEAIAELMGLLAPASDAAGAIESAVSVTRLLTNNPELFDEERARRRHEVFHSRSYDPSGVARQAMAVAASGDRSDRLRALEVPTLVIHGDLDPLIDISGGRRTAELVAGARFVEIEGMGHDLNPVFWARYVDETISLLTAHPDAA